MAVLVSKGITVPSLDVLGSDLSVGDIVKLSENGTDTEYILVHKGLPSSSYDSSCDGLWFLRKDCCLKEKFNSKYDYDIDDYSNNYQKTSAHTYLNGTFFNLLGAEVQSAVKQVKIPYVNGTGDGSVASGTNGLSTKVFFLCGYELGWTSTNNSALMVFGSCLDYFKGLSATDAKRSATFNGASTSWWLRTPYKNDDTGFAVVTGLGGLSFVNVTTAWSYRPAFILPHNSVFEPKTLLFKGVK